MQHLFAPRALAAPMHRHRLEDEYTYVLDGRIGAVIEGTEVIAEPGDLLFKPGTSGTRSGTPATSPPRCWS